MASRWEAKEGRREGRRVELGGREKGAFRRGARKERFPAGVAVNMAMQG